MFIKQFSEKINRPIDEVFKYASDPNNLVEWGEGIQEVTITSNNPLDVGAKYVVKNKMGRQIQEFENEVVVYAPPQKYGFRTGGGAYGFYTSTRTFEERDGKTQVIEKIEAEGPTGLLKILMPLVINLSCV